MADTRFGSLGDFLGQAVADVNDLQARVQELEDRERLQKPCTRIAALEAENAELARRVAELENHAAKPQAVQKPKR